MTDRDETPTDGGDTASGGTTQTTVESESSTASDSAAAESADDATGEAGGNHRDERSEPGFDEIFGLLKNRRRRGVLRHLAAESEKARLGELAERIAALECDKAVSQIDSNERKRVYVALYQCHLPKMEDFGAITYDKPRGTIERGPNFALFDHYLPDDEDSTEPTASPGTWLRSLADLTT